MSGKMELLAGPQAERATKAPDVEVFEYAVNRAAFNALLVVAGLFFAGAGALWWFSGLDEAVWTVMFVCLMLVGVGFSTMAAYWQDYATKHLVALSDDHFYVGSDKGLWAISWDLLDSKSMGFEEMNLSRYGGGLQMDVGGQRIKVHLANAIAYLDNLEEFMGGVLMRLLTDEEREELARRLAEEEAKAAEEAALAEAAGDDVSGEEE